MNNNYNYTYFNQQRPLNYYGINHPYMYNAVQPYYTNGITPQNYIKDPYTQLNNGTNSIYQYYNGIIQHHHPSQGNKPQRPQKRKNIDNNFPKKIECTFCNIYFKSNNEYDDHIKESHVECDVEGCSYHAPLEILEIHRLKHIKNDKGESIIDSAEETRKWIIARKLRHPCNKKRKINTVPSQSTQSVEETNATGSNVNSNEGTSSVHPSTSLRPAVSPPNYLPVNGNATPGDRGDKPAADLREAEGEVNRRGTTPSGNCKTTNVGEVVVNLSSMDTSGVNPDELEECLLETILRENHSLVKERNVECEDRRSILYPVISKVKRQPSALLRLSNPVKYEQLLRRLDSKMSPYSYKSALGSDLKCPHMKKSGTCKYGNKCNFNEKFSINVPKRPPMILELVKNEVYNYDKLLVDIIKTIVQHNFFK